MAEQEELKQLRIEKMHKLLGTALGKSAYFLNHNEKTGMLIDITELIEEVKDIVEKLVKDEKS